MARKANAAPRVNIPTIKGYRSSVRVLWNSCQTAPEICAVLCELIRSNPIYELAAKREGIGFRDGVLVDLREDE